MAARESWLGGEMRENRARLEKLVVALQSLARAPRSALLLYPGGPVAVARGAGLMASVSPHLDARIADLRARIEALERLRTGQEVARVEARGALAALQELRADTADALRRRDRASMPQRYELVEQAAAAAGQARDLDGLAVALRDAARQGRDAVVTFTEARGLMAPPVQGVVTAGFGDPDPWGRPGAGVTLSAPAYAQVSAPWDGTIRFAGPLIDYGQVVVIEPEAGTLIVLAGLADIDRVVGETVLAGERLGDLGGPLPDSEEFLLEATTDRDQIGAEKLYIEIRRGGEPVDPALWFNLAKQGTDG
jgi:septal ring factor EnvC (AmiA/AmiB activator)